MNLRSQNLWRCVALSIGVLSAPGCREEPNDLSLVGTVERNLIEISAPVAEVIVEVPVARGQHVEAGAVLVRLDPLLAEADLAAAQAAVAGAQTQTEVAEQQHRRGLGLHSKGVASDEVLDRARLARDEARAALRSAMARMAAAQKRLNDTTLRAPASATVDQIPFDTGERVAAGSVVAVLLADGRPWVRVWVPERAFARVGPGTAADVRIDGIPGPLRAHVMDLAREPEYTPHYALTERERVYLVYQARVEIEDAPTELRPGAPAEVRIALPPLAGAKSPR